MPIEGVVFIDYSMFPDARRLDRSQVLRSVAYGSPVPWAPGDSVITSIYVEKDGYGFRPANQLHFGPSPYQLFANLRLTNVPITPTRDSTSSCER